MELLVDVAKGNYGLLGDEQLYKGHEAICMTNNIKWKIIKLGIVWD